MRERTREALRQAKLDGKVLGRPAYDSKIRDNVERLYRNPDISIKDVAKKAGVSTRTVNRIAKERNLSRLFIKGTSFLE